MCSHHPHPHPHTHSAIMVMAACYSKIEIGPEGNQRKERKYPHGRRTTKPGRGEKGYRTLESCSLALKRVTCQEFLMVMRLFSPPVPGQLGWR